MNEETIYEQLSVDEIEKIKKYDSLHRTVQRIKNSISDLEFKILKSERQISTINKEIEEIKDACNKSNCESLDMSSPIKFLPSDVFYLEKIEELKVELNKKDKFIEELKLKIDKWSHYIEKYENLKQKYEEMSIKLNSFDKNEYFKILDKTKVLEEKIRVIFTSIKCRYKEKDIWKQNKSELKSYLKLLTSIKRKLYNRQKNLKFQKNNKIHLEEAIGKETLIKEKLSEVILDQKSKNDELNKKILNLEEQLLECDKENKNNLNASVEDKITNSEKRLNVKDIKLEELNLSLANQIQIRESLILEKSKLNSHLENCKKRVREKEQLNYELKNILTSSCKELLDKNLTYVTEERENMRIRTTKKMKAGSRFVY